MEKIYIPIGFQCTVPTVLKNLNIRTSSFPFDWMLSNPKFVHDMLKLLLVDQISTTELVTHHFFNCGHFAVQPDVAEHHIEVMDTSAPTPNRRPLLPYNKQHKVIFPHDEVSPDTIYKYIRRFDRLKQVLIGDNELVLVYISQSSNIYDDHIYVGQITYGDFSIDGVNILTDVYTHLTNIYNLVNSVRVSRCKMIMMDSIGSSDVHNLHPDIVYTPVEPKKDSGMMVGECATKLYERIQWGLVT